MDASELKRMKELEEENRRLKMMYTELELKNVLSGDLKNQKKVEMEAIQIKLKMDDNDVLFIGKCEKTTSCSLLKTEK